MKTNAGRLGAPSGSEADPLQLLSCRAGNLEHIAGLEQAHIVASTIQIVGNHIQHARHHGSAHDRSFFAQRISQFDYRQSGELFRLLMRNKRQRNGFVVAEGER